jgi:hypothetical protein
VRWLGGHGASPQGLDIATAPTPQPSEPHLPTPGTVDLSGGYGLAESSTAAPVEALPYSPNNHGSTHKREN